MMRGHAKDPYLTEKWQRLRFPARTIDTMRWAAIVLFEFALLSFLFGMVFAVLSVQVK
jgi:hypothetical protein